MIDPGDYEDHHERRAHVRLIDLDPELLRAAERESTRKYLEKRAKAVKANLEAITNEVERLRQSVHDDDEEILTTALTILEDAQRELDKVWPIRASHGWKEHIERLRAENERLRHAIHQEREELSKAVLQLKQQIERKGRT